MPPIAPTAPGSLTPATFIKGCIQLPPSAPASACMDASVPPPATNSAFQPVDASRWFMAASTEEQPAPASGSCNAPSGAGDGGRGGERKGHALLAEILGPTSSLSIIQKLAHISLALAEGSITQEELRAYCSEHLSEGSLVPLRHRFIPELLTDDEVIDKALEEAQAGKISNQTLARLRRRNEGTSPQTIKENEPFLFDVPYKAAGPIMQALMVRFTKVTEPKSPAPSFGLYASHDPEPDARMRHNEQQYSRRLATRQAIVSAMTALGAKRATAFFDAMLAARISPDAQYPKSSQAALEAEAYNAARAALVQIGGRQLLERLESLVESAYTADKNAPLLPEFGKKPPFQEMGTSLLNMLRAGEASEEEIKETVMRIMQGALALYDERSERDDLDLGIFSMDSTFAAIAEIGIWSIIPLAERVQMMLDATDSWNLGERTTLASLVKGLESSAERLPDAKDAGTLLEPHIQRLLRSVLSVIGRFDEICASPEGTRYIESFRYQMSLALDNTILTMMERVPSELVDVLANDPASRGAFSVWREEQLMDIPDER